MDNQVSQEEILRIDENTVHESVLHSDKIDLSTLDALSGPP